MKISQVIDPAIQVLDASGAQETIVNKQYFIAGDACYEDAFQG